MCRLYCYLFAVHVYTLQSCILIGLNLGDISGLSAAQSADSSGLSSSVNELEDTVNAMDSTVGGMELSMIVMVIWVVIVTVALVVIGVLSFRRWRRHVFQDGGSSVGTSAQSSQSSSDRSDSLGSDIGNLMEAGLGAGGIHNDGFQSDNNSLTVSLDMDADDSPAEVHQGPSIVSPDNQESSPSPESLDLPEQTVTAQDGTRL